MEDLIMLMKLMSYREIGNRLTISSKTVESHLRNVKRKLGVSKKSELYELAVRNHFL